MAGSTLASRGWEGVKSYVPLIPTEAKRQRKLRQRAEETEAIERARQRAGETPDARTASGDHSSSFNKAFVEAIRRGQSRRDVTGTLDMLIREIICSEQFVQAIEHGAVRTPLEESDSTHAIDVQRRRVELAAQLNIARSNRRHMIGNLTTLDLDILHSTMVRCPQIWDGWPEGQTNPSEAFLRFLESVAQHKHPGREGEFIGMVLKEFSTRKTFTDSKERAGGSILDPSYAATYLYRRSAEPLERAVNDFGTLVNDILSTPTNANNPTLNMPGFGYSEHADRGLEERSLAVRTLHEVIGDLGDTIRMAAERRETAEREIGDYVDTVRRELQQTERRDSQIQGNERSTEQEKRESRRELNEARQRYSDLQAQINGTARIRDDHIHHHITELREASADETVAREQLQMAEGELREAQAELRRFSLEGSTDAVSRQLIDHFRALLIEHRESGADLRGVADRIAERLPNVAVTAHLDRVQELLTEREEMVQYLRTPAPQQQIQGQPIAPTPVRVDYAPLLQDRVDEFNGKLDAFEREVDRTNLPEATRTRFRRMATALRNFDITREFIDAQLTETKNNHAFPLRRAALLVVERMERRNYETIVGLSDAQRLEAVRVWEAASDIDSIPARGEGGWAKFKHKLAYHTISGRGWRAKGRWLWNHSFGTELEHLTENPKGKVMARDYTDQGQGSYYPTVWPRWSRGVAGLVVKGILATGALSFTLGAQEVKLLNPLTWPAPIVQAFGGPVYTQSKDWYRPWTWGLPLATEKEIRRVIHDSYDIPGRLTERGSEYYKRAYGIGKTLQGEADSTGVEARLRWLATNQDVLTFMQERKTMKVVAEVKKLDERPVNCSTSATPLPASCGKLGIKTVEDVEAYQPVEADKWKPGMQVCCTIELDYNAISDGLRLNTGRSDQFVARLMAEEQDGKTISYEYLNDQVNRARWVREGFLISELEFQIMETSRVTDLNNVQFLLSQGKQTSEIRLAMGKVGEAKYHVEEEHRDSFLSMLRDNIVRVAGARTPAVVINPVMEEVPQDIFDEAMTQTLRGTQADWVRNTTVEFQRHTVEKELSGLGLHEASLDVCVVQTDVKEFLLGFKQTASPYRLNVERSDEFVQLLVQHKRDGGQLGDYDPFGYPQGSRVEWAKGTGLIVQISEPTAQSVVTTEVLSAEGQTFFQNSIFGARLDEAVQKLFDASGPNGATVQEVLVSKYGGDKEQFMQAIRADWFTRLTRATTNSTQSAYLKANGLTVTTTESGLEVQVDDDKAPIILGREVLRFVKQTN